MTDRNARILPAAPKRFPGWPTHKARDRHRRRAQAAKARSRERRLTRRRNHSRTR